jgi:multiple sugar transport system permease protein
MNIQAPGLSIPSAPAHVSTYRLSKAVRGLANYAALIALLVFFAFPIVFMVVMSFKTDVVQVTRDLGSIRAFVPYGQLGLDNYAQVFQRIDFPRYLLNTFIIIGFQLSFGLLFESMLAFALARLRWRGRNLVLTMVVLLIIIPDAALTVPRLQLVNWLGWFDSYQVIIVPFLIVPLHVFLFYQFFIGLPKDFDEAALVDGASYWQIYWNIVLPMSRPVIATVTILGFLAGWGTYLWPLLTTHSPDYWPIMVGLSYFRNQQPQVPAQIMAFSSMVVIPVLIVFGLFQKWFIRSIASSGIKG